MLFQRKTSTPTIYADIQTGMIDDKLSALEAERQKIFEAASEQQRDDFERAQEDWAAVAAERGARFDALVEDVSARFEHAQEGWRATFDVAHKKHAEIMRGTVEQRQREFLEQVRAHDALAKDQLDAFRDHAKEYVETATKLSEEAHDDRVRECARLKDSIEQTLQHSVEAQNALLDTAEARREEELQEMLDARKAFQGKVGQDNLDINGLPLEDARPMILGQLDASWTHILAARSRPLRTPFESPDPSTRSPSYTEGEQLSPGPQPIIIIPPPQRPDISEPGRTDSRGSTRPPSIISVSSLPPDQRFSHSSNVARAVCGQNEALRDRLAAEAEYMRDTMFHAAEAERDRQNAQLRSRFDALEGELQTAFEAMTTRHDNAVAGLMELLAVDDSSHRAHFLQLQTRRQTAFQGLLDRAKQRSSAQSAMADYRVAALQTAVEHLRASILYPARARRDAIFEEAQRAREARLDATNDFVAPPRVSPIPVTRHARPCPYPGGSPLRSGPSWSCPYPVLETGYLCHDPLHVPRREWSRSPSSPRRVEPVGPITPSPPCSQESTNELQILEQWCAARQDAREQAAMEASQRRAGDFARRERVRVREFEGDQRARASRASQTLRVLARRFADVQLEREARFLKQENHARKAFSAGQAEREQIFTVTTRVREEQFLEVMDELSKTRTEREVARSETFREWMLDVQKKAVEDEVCAVRLFKEEERARRERFVRAMS